LWLGLLLRLSETNRVYTLVALILLKLLLSNLSVAFELNFLTAIVNEALIVIAFAVGLEKHRKAIDSKHAVVLRVVDHFDFLDIVLRKLRTLSI